MACEIFFTRIMRSLRSWDEFGRLIQAVPIARARAEERPGTKERRRSHDGARSSLVE
jgi:hypothetical protein